VAAEIPAALDAPVGRGGHAEADLDAEDHHDLDGDDLTVRAGDVDALTLAPADDKSYRYLPWMSFRR